MSLEAPTPDQSASPQDAQQSRPVTRRHALTGVAVAGVGVPLLAACGEGAGENAGKALDDATKSAGDAASDATKKLDQLTSIGEIPEGGGKIFADADTVITQPTAGDYKAFSATCTHQGCKVSSVEDGNIVCKCHNSMFSISDGSVTGGPANAPLPEKGVKVNGDGISVS
jgi:Rieske Fe-S protein